jgi:hypothetical protein
LHSRRGTKRMPVFSSFKYHGRHPEVWWHKLAKAEARANREGGTLLTCAPLCSRCSLDGERPCPWSASKYAVLGGYRSSTEYRLRRSWSWPCGHPVVGSPTGLHCTQSRDCRSSHRSVSEGRRRRSRRRRPIQPAWPNQLRSSLGMDMPLDPVTAVCCIIKGPKDRRRDCQLIDHTDRYALCVCVYVPGVAVVELPS